MILLMEDLRGAFFPVSPRTEVVRDLAGNLDYTQVALRAQMHLEDDYQDGLFFRTSFENGGYEDPPFHVIRDRDEASPALVAAVEALCEYPEYRLTFGEE